MKRFVIPGIIVVIVAVEFVLALTGPMAFVQKPSMVVTLPYTTGLTDDENAAVFDQVQESFARTRVFRVIPHSLIENYYLEKEDIADFVIDESMSYTDYEAMAQELELERVAVISAHAYADEVDVTITIRNITTDSIGPRFKYEAASVQGFFAGERADGSTFDLADDLREETRGVSLFDNLVFLLFIGQAILAVLLAFGRKPDLYNQVLMVTGLILFLFAFIYAKNASMDYVQRFIANNGAISLAESTLTEQLYSLVRFAPLFLVNLFLWIRRRIGGNGDAVPAGRGFTENLGLVATTWGLGLALLSALLYSLSIPSFASMRGIPVLAWFAMVPLLVTLIHSRPAAGVLYVIAFGALTSLILNYWHGTYSYISLAVSVIITTLFFVALAPILVLTIKGLGRWGFFAVPALWIAFDFARTAGYIGYPWGFFGISQYQFIPFIQMADLGGIWLVTFVLVLVNAALAWMLVYDQGRRWLPGIVAGAVVAASLIYGGVMLGVGRRQIQNQAGETMRVVLVQQNTDPRKHDYRLSYETLVEQTQLALAESSPLVPDLIVWPEGGFKPDVRYWLDRPRSTSTSSQLVQELFEFTPTLGTYLVTGTQDHVYLPEGEDGEDVKRNFNSTMYVGTDGEIVDFYHKMHLVPFTEHFPYKDRFPGIATLLDKFDTSNWKQGEERTIFSHPVADFFTPICFEDVFPNDIRRFVADGGELIVNVTNDYWSLDPVQGKQHAVHALFRAIENRRPMVRATSSGLTTYITPEGRLSSEYPEYYTAGYLTVDIPIVERKTTLYTRAGDWLPWLTSGLSAAALVTAAVMLIRRRQERAPE